MIKYLATFLILIAPIAQAKVIVSDSYDVASGATCVITRYSELEYYNACGQTFNFVGGVLDSAKFKVASKANTSGNVLVKIYALTGTSGTDGKPTGSALATSDAIDSTTLVNGWNTFTFSGANRVALSPNKYGVSFEYTSSGDTDYIEVSIVTSSPTHAGNYFYDETGTWAVDNAIDSNFYVYTETGDDGKTAFIGNTTIKGNLVIK